MFCEFKNIMAGDLISCTGFVPDIKNIHRRAIEGMGGRYQGHLDRSVTVLVVGQAGTDKYKFAEHENISIVKETWLYDSFRNHCRMPVEDYVPDFFIGLKICCTQLPPDIRQRIARKAAKQGAEYTPDLRKDYNTHLLAMWAEGRKFEFAQRWKMKIVHPRWFYDCLERGQYLDEANYPVTPGPPQQVLNGIVGEEDLQLLGEQPDDGLYAAVGPIQQALGPEAADGDTGNFNGDDTHEDPYPADVLHIGHGVTVTDLLAGHVNMDAPDGAMDGEEDNLPVLQRADTELLQQSTESAGSASSSGAEAAGDSSSSPSASADEMERSRGGKTPAEGVSNLNIEENGMDETSGMHADA